jgi:hypothetical protein
MKGRVCCNWHVAAEKDPPDPGTQKIRSGRYAGLYGGVSSSDYGFTPDVNPAVLIEKGCLEIKLSFPLYVPEAGAVVKKAGDIRPGSRPGPRPISTGRPARRK